MKLPRSLSEVVLYCLRANVVEPSPRVKDMDHVPRGLRHLPVRPRYVAHNYEIRGGITRTAVFVQHVNSVNSLFADFTQRMGAGERPKS